MATKKASTPKPGSKPRGPRKKPVAPSSRGLTPTEVGAKLDGIDELIKAVGDDGGSVLANYRDPLGGKAVLLVGLPIDKVEPTPYQRDLSEAHVKKLTTAMEKVGRFLDPVIVVRQNGKYWTPNGNHRLATLKGLGAKSIVGLLLPEPELAYQILALNTEKAHNLKERSLEVIRMVRGMVAATPDRKEAEASAMLEEPAFITLGACYEKRPRFSGGAYNPILKRVEHFLEQPFKEALPLREARADQLLLLDDLVIQRVAELKAKGFESPYLKNFVVARTNPIRFQKGGNPDFAPTIEKMIANVQQLDITQVNKEQIASMGGVAAAEAGGEDGA
jgi:ParB family chromosome partitioning protein